MSNTRKPASAKMFNKPDEIVIYEFLMDPAFDCEQKSRLLGNVKYRHNGAGILRNIITLADDDLAAIRPLRATADEHGRSKEADPPAVKHINWVKEVVNAELDILSASARLRQ